MEGSNYDIHDLSVPYSRSSVALFRRFNPRANFKASLEYWVKMLIGTIADAEWLVPPLYRLSQLISHLDPSPASEEGLFLSSSYRRAQFISEFGYQEERTSKDNDRNSWCPYTPTHAPDG